MLACSRSPSASAIDIIANPFGPGVIRFAGPSRVGFTVFWIVGMINSINWIDGLDGLSPGVALIAAVTLGLISLTTSRSSQPLIALLCAVLAARWPGSCPGTSTRRKIFAGTTGVQFVGYTLAVLSILGSAKVAVALLVLGVPIIDTFWIIVRRLPRAARRSPPTVRTSTTGCWTSGCPTATRSWSSTGSAPSSGSSPSSCPRVTQLYAFLGIFVVSGLVLFGPTRGAFRRPEEPEAEAYEADE